MGIFSETGFSSFQRLSLGSIAFLLSSVLLQQFGLVSCVPEDYYNPDYDEAGLGFEMDGNWGNFNPDVTDTGLDAMKRHLGALASSKSRLSGLTGLRSHRSDIGFGDDDATFGRFVRTSSWSPFARFAEHKAQSGFGIPQMKKRFLGSLARGGWFPRQFRGSVDSQQPQWDKRHIGAAARFGRLRSQNNKRDLFDGDFQGSINEAHQYYLGSLGCDIIDMLGECLRHFSTCLTLRREIHRSSRNHYDILNLTPKASNQEIKQAYYKLSLLYHPDKPEGDETKFREITAAYEVLGNRKLRRLYDSGVLGRPDSTRPVHREQGFDIKHEDLERFRKGVSQADEKDRRFMDTTYYDKWTRDHYTRTMDRDNRRKALHMRDMAFKKSEKDSKFGMFMTLACLALTLYYLTRENPHDKPSKKS